MSLIISAGLWMVVGIYKIAAFVFELFLILGTGQLLDKSVYQVMLSNFYILIGIVMLFIVAFTLLKGMINPDEQKKGTSAIKKIIVNLITSMMIMALLPTIFTFAYEVQDSFINQYNVIGKFFGYGNASASKDDPVNTNNIKLVKTGSYKIVNGIFTAFLNVNLDACKTDGIEVKDNSTLEQCQKLDKSERKTEKKYDYQTT